MITTIPYAHLTKKRGGGYTLMLNAEIRPVNPIREFAVTGKREATQICKMYNSKPWNF
jgi:hypothetical protein